MIKIDGLLDELINMGHSREWAEKKVRLILIDNQMDYISTLIDKYQSDITKVKALENEYLVHLQDLREKVYNDLCNTKDNE